MPKPSGDEWVPLAVVGRPHGVRGEIRASSFNKDSQLLLGLDEVLVRFVDGNRAGEAHEVTIDGARIGNDAILVKLADVDDRNAAEELRGAQLCVKRGDFPPLEEGEFYACDVVGAKAVDLEGKELGIVRNFSSYPSVDILLVETPHGRFEVPLIDPYVERVEPEQSLVVLKTLEGLDPS